MSPLHFYKYQGAGNDFIIIDARAQLPFALDDQPRIAALCDRHFGIGADGLMLLREKAGYDFEMVYYNADGHPSSMCGNGGRCIVAFAHFVGIERDVYNFLAVDGPHQAKLLASGDVALEMLPVTQVQQAPDHFTLDTGSPHYITYVPNCAEVALIPSAKAIRYNEVYAKEGINVNFVHQLAEGLAIRTYERGVEDETLACGTGVTAAAITLAIKQQLPVNTTFDYPVKAVGGDLSVKGKVSENGFEDLWLTGPAQQVFSGVI